MQRHHAKARHQIVLAAVFYELAAVLQYGIYLLHQQRDVTGSPWSMVMTRQQDMIARLIGCFSHLFPWATLSQMDIFVSKPQTIFSRTHSVCLKSYPAPRSSPYCQLQRAHTHALTLWQSKPHHRYPIRGTHHLCRFSSHSDLAARSRGRPAKRKPSVQQRSLLSSRTLPTTPHLACNAWVFVGYTPVSFYSTSITSIPTGVLNHIKRPLQVGLDGPVRHMVAIAMFDGNKVKLRVCAD